MNSIHKLKFLVVALSVASLATVGCSKDEKKKGDDKKGQAGETAKDGDKAGAARATAPKAAAGAKGAFDVFSKDTGMVMGINLGEISSSNLYKQFVEPQIKAKADKEFAEFKATCGFDPITTIKQVLVGGVMGPDMQPQEDKMLVVVKGMSRKQLTDCAAKMAEKEGEKVELTEEGKFTKVVKDGETVYLGWMDDMTFAMSPKMEKAALEARLGGADGLSGNKAMMDLLGQTDQKAGMWLAMQKPEGAAAMPSPVPFNAIFASISFKGGLKVDAGIRQASADDAKKTVDQVTQMLDGAKQQAGPFGKYLSKVEISAKDADVIAKVSLSDAELDEIIKTAGPMMGAMMGGM